MSGDALPISSRRFAEALESLSDSSLNEKAAEICNSMLHLESSNNQLQPFADTSSDAYDKTCAEAIVENEEVLGRMRMRLDLLKAEVESRGLRWVWDELNLGQSARQERLNGDVNVDGNIVDTHSSSNGMGQAASTNANSRSQNTSGSLTDEELANRIQERFGGNDSNDSGGNGMDL